VGRRGCLRDPVDLDAVVSGRGRNAWIARLRRDGGEREVEEFLIECSSFVLFCCSN
jgi:hypothetical protein